MENSQLQELLDKQELYEVVVRYCRGVDRADEELLRSAYHPDAIDDHGAFVGTVDEFVEFVGERSLSPENWPEPIQHSISNATFEIDGDVAYGETYFEARKIDDKMLSILGIGRYVDRFERRDGEWRIAHRRVIIEYAGEGWDTADPYYRDRRDPSYERLAG